MKTPGQKAYEAAIKWRVPTPEVDSHRWELLTQAYRDEWEAIAAAVTASDPKSYGEILGDAMNASEHFNWNITTVHDAEMERCAQAVIAEYRKREGLE